MKKKEELKMEIQKSFTKIRNAINDREDELLSDIDKNFSDLFLDGEIIKETEKLPNKIQLSLDKGKSISNITNNSNNNNLNSLINDCLNIEINIGEINKINQRMIKFKSSQNKIEFIQTEEDINKLCDKIKYFGLVYQFPFSEIIKRDDFLKIDSMIGSKNKFILKYNAKRDSCNTEIFHERCDNICGSLFICKIKDGDNVGGYLTAKIQKKNIYLDNSKAFLFNLSQNIIKKNTKEFKNAIQNFIDSSFFIKFGCNCKVFSL